MVSEILVHHCREDVMEHHSNQKTKEREGEDSYASQNVVGLHLCDGTIHNQSGPSLLGSPSLKKAHGDTPRDGLFSCLGFF